MGWKHHVDALCWKKDWYTSENSWHHHDDGRLSGNTEATPQDSQKVKMWLQLGIPVGQCTAMAKVNEIKGLAWPSQSPDLNPTENVSEQGHKPD